MHHIIQKRNYKAVSVNGRRYCEDDPAATAQAAADAAAATAAAAEAAKIAAQNNKTFTQDEMNKIIQERTAEYANKHNKVKEQLEALTKQSAGTADERKALQDKMLELQSTLRTKEEQAAFEKKKLEEDSKSAIDKVTSERDQWADRYKRREITSSIANAATANDAYRAEQIVELLSPKAKLVEAVDNEGKPTGEMEVKIKWNDVDKDGNPVEMTLSPAETVKAMKQKENFANLFVAKEGGTGFVPTRGAQYAGSTDPDKMTMSDYMKGGRERVLKK